MRARFDTFPTFGLVAQIIRWYPVQRTAPGPEAEVCSTAAECGVQSIDEFLADCPSNRGKWGEDDQVGSLNYLRPSSRFRSLPETVMIALFERRTFLQAVALSMVPPLVSSARAMAAGTASRTVSSVTERTTMQNESTHRTLTLNGLHFHVAEQGEGPLVLLCHGWPAAPGCSCRAACRHDRPRAIPELPTEPGSSPRQHLDDRRRQFRRHRARYPNPHLAGKFDLDHR